mmetsp:Transcript_43587/g.114982  ORF Transcript_43587/g.114982 Transcript_43587/m.114982 type:complete len:338 (+) Transcript_43587:1088-2101(+)
MPTSARKAQPARFAVLRPSFVNGGSSTHPSSWPLARSARSPWRKMKTSVPGAPTASPLSGAGTPSAEICAPTLAFVLAFATTPTSWSSLSTTSTSAAGMAATAAAAAAAAAANALAGGADCTLKSTQEGFANRRTTSSASSSVVMTCTASYGSCPDRSGGLRPRQKESTTSSACSGLNVSCAVRARARALQTSGEVAIHTASKWSCTSFTEPFSTARFACCIHKRRSLGVTLQRSTTQDRPRLRALTISCSQTSAVTISSWQTYAQPSFTNLLLNVDLPLPGKPQIRTTQTGLGLLSADGTDDTFFRPISCGCPCTIPKPGLADMSFLLVPFAEQRS